MKKIFPLFIVVISFSLAFVPDNQAGRKWEIYLIPQTHLDIGYTELQDDVMRRQWRNLEAAMQIIESSRDLPEAARFRWNPEATWAIQAWFEQADADQKERFIRHVREGYIGLDAMYANMLSELCRPEELRQAISYKYELERMTGTPIDSAMITDIPGWTWGLVTALSESGVKYLSLGPNRTARLGYTLADYADRPFYWVSPSGKHKVLCFIHGKGYSWFHTLITLIVDVKPPNKFTERRIYGYLQQLENSDYPYDIIPIRYAVGSDNGPPDPNISAIVDKWNRKHPNVQVKISTASQALREFEKRYGDKLPTYSGDFTPYWTDGVASTARETAINRNASETLIQAQTLWSLMKPNEFPAADFAEAWKNVLLFSEHTWGAFNSIWNPDSDLATLQWDWKKQRAEDAVKQTEKIISGILSPWTWTGNVPNNELRMENERPYYRTVINTNSWPVTGPVLIDGWNGQRAVVKTEDGKQVPSQILSDGALYFLAENVPGMSSKRYSIEIGTANALGKCAVGEHSISNGKLEVNFDPEEGTISSIKNVETGTEFVNNNFKDKFNEYIYIEGRSPETGRRKISSEAQFTVKEAGPLVCSIEIKRKAFNSDSLITTVTMYDGLDRIDIANELDRPTVRSKEGIHFAFPVAAANPAVRYDVAWGSVQVDIDQMKGACKNYFTPLRWVDVSGGVSGMEFVLRDAPLFEAGEITNDPIKYGWLRETKHNGAIYSYVMNNYWESNYKADQPGKTTLRYSLFPHGVYDVAANMRRSLEVMQPLLVGHLADSEIPQPPMAIDNKNIIIESVENVPAEKGFIVNLFNITAENQAASISPRGICGEIFTLKNDRKAGQSVGNRVEFGKHESIRLFCK